MNKKIIALVIGLGLVLTGVYYLNSTKSNVGNQSEVSQSEEKDVENEYIAPNEKVSKEQRDLEENAEDVTIEENTDDTITTSEVESDTEVKATEIKKVQNASAEIKKNETGDKNANIVDSKEESTTVEIKEESEAELVPEPEEIKLTPEEIEASIVEKYNELLTNLKNKYEIKVNSLIEQGKAEYFSLSEEERKKQRLKLGLKYLNLGKQLENECDEEFYALLDQMKKELKENDLKMDSANEAEKQYKSEKSERRKALLSKAMKKD